MAQSMLSCVSRHKPRTWSSSTSNEYSLKDLSACPLEYILVTLKIKRTLPEAKIVQVFRVENHFLYGCYLLKKEEYSKRYGSVTEKELFHATGTENVTSIAKQNLDWRRSERTKFGNGVSFSPDAKYANTHCNRRYPTRRAMFVANVLVHSTCGGSPYMKLPAMGADTSTGNNNSVYVKYYDNEFYPSYVAYYDSPPIVRRRRYF